MTPQEKSKELISKYLTPNLVHPLYGVLSYENSIYCALIAVEEIIEIVGSDETAIIVELPFWKEVKQELLKQQSNVT